MRHRIANLFYSLGEAIDAPSGRLNGSGAGLTSGDEAYQPGDYRNTSVDTSIHLRENHPVWADFQPGSYTYAALHVGKGSRVTIFLNRKTTRKLLTALRFVDEQFRIYGESGR